MGSALPVNDPTAESPDFPNKPPDGDSVSSLIESLSLTRTSSSTNISDKPSGNPKTSSIHESFSSANDRQSRLGRSSGMENRRYTPPTQLSMVAGSWRQGSTASPSPSGPSVDAQSFGPRTLIPGVQSVLSPGQLDLSYSYAFHRGNGVYTRLIPADNLPALEGLVRTQGDTSGLIILPVPRGSSSAVDRLNQQKAIILSSQRPRASTLPGTDSIQGRIDQIVASTPPLRDKVFCSKWVHDGTCAFTQTGCKYKHEMPMDRATQHELGLFNGLPAWWKRQQGIELRPSPPHALDSPCSGGSRSVGYEQSVPALGSGLGPIARPRPAVLHASNAAQATSPVISSGATPRCGVSAGGCNPYDMLSAFDEEDEYA